MTKSVFQISTAYLHELLLLFNSVFLELHLERHCMAYGISVHAAKSVPIQIPPEKAVCVPCGNPGQQESPGFRCREYRFAFQIEIGVSLHIL